MHLRTIVVLCFMAVVAYAVPPAAPGGGVIERQLEKEYEAQPLQQDKEIPPIQIDIPEEKLEIPEGVSVSIKTIEIQGNEAMPYEKIWEWILEFEGKELSLKDIYALCAKIDARYAKEGYFLARAYPPPQTIENGRLIIKIMEGHLGEVRVEGNQFYSERFILSYFRKLQGAPLNYNSFMRTLLLLSENSDLKAGAVFAKGKKVGTADVIVRVEDQRPLHLYLNANNYGRKLTTNFRVGGRVDAGSLCTYGDMLSVAGVLGLPVHDLYFTDVIYKVPLDRSGTDLELSYLFSKFKVEEMLSLRLRGRSDIFTVKSTRAMIRTREVSVDLFGWFDFMQIQNYQLNETTSFDKLRVLRFGGLYDLFSSRGFRHYLNAKISLGIPHFLGGLKSVDKECSRAGAGGLFFKINGDYDWLQTLYKNYFLYVHASLQISAYRLAIPEQIYLGGADTIRGYPLACALGDNGYYFNFEVRMPPPVLAQYRFFMSKSKWSELVQIVGFLDHGGAFLAGGQNNFLTGMGFGFRLNWPKNMSLSLDVGFPLVHDSLSTGAVTYIKVTGQPF